MDRAPEADVHFPIEGASVLARRLQKLLALDRTFVIDELAQSPSDVQLSDGRARRSPLFDAYLEFTQLRDASLRVGQYRVPFSRQRVMPFGNLAMVDRATR